MISNIKEGMKNYINHSVLRKLVLFLLFLLLVPMFSSCEKNKKNDKIIAADSLWYDSKRIELDPLSNSEQSEISHTLFRYYNNEVQIICQYYLPPTDEEILSENFDELACYRTEMYIFDNNGDMKKRIDLSRLIRDDINPNAGIRSYGFFENRIYVLSETDGDSPEDIITVIDVDQENIVDNILYTSEAMRAIRFVYSGDITIINKDVFMLCSDSNTILFLDNNGNYRKEELSKLFDQDIFLVDIYSSNEQVTFYSANADSDDECITIGDNTVALQIKPVDLGTAFGTEVTEDGAFYAVGNLGISKYNDETSNFDLVVPSYGYNVDLYELSRMSVLYANDNEMVLANVHSVNPREGIVLYHLTRSDVNPNAGKHILSVGLFGDYVISPTVGKAIYDYNALSESCFATVKMYDYKNNYFEDGDSIEISCQEAASVLMKDILDGNGPDVIINAFDILQLCDEKFLCNLNDFISTDSHYNSNEYLCTVIDLAQIDNCLYQIPIKFSIIGISAPDEYAPSNGLGYDYEEYKEVISLANNGADPLAYQLDRSSYYSLLFSSGMNEFCDEGEWNLNCSAYEELASYCKESVPKDCIVKQMDEDFSYPDFVVDYPQYVGIYRYAVLYANEQNIYGFPSKDGSHGVMLSVNSSAGISSQSENKDDAWEFIKVLMSYDVQCKETVYGSINLDALMESGNEAINSYNNSNAELKKTDPGKLASMGIRVTDDIDSSFIDSYIDMLTNATGVDRVDGQILIITKEEIQAYYADQKSFYDVVAVMNDRIKTYTEE